MNYGITKTNNFVKFKVTYSPGCKKFLRFQKVSKGFRICSTYTIFNLIFNVRYDINKNIFNSFGNKITYMNP